jgi:hypothetical protein
MAWKLRKFCLRLIFIKELLSALGQKTAMQRCVHSLACLLLALALVLTGPGGAGPAKGAMLVELCADDTTSLVWIDSAGNPIAPGRTHAKCLDCLLFSAPLPDEVAALLALDPLCADTGLSLPMSSLTHSIAHLRPMPRGPPATESLDMRHGDPRPCTRSLHPMAQPPLDFPQATHKARVTDLRANL